jgi:hypothetical protein
MGHLGPTKIKGVAARTFHLWQLNSGIHHFDLVIIRCTNMVSVDISPPGHVAVCRWWDSYWDTGWLFSYSWHFFDWDDFILYYEKKKLR